jgi:hypothetical protein
MCKRDSLRGGASILLGLALLVCATGSVFSQSAQEENLPAGDAKAKAENACLSCHEARIIAQQRLSKGAWTKEVDKMTKWGADVDPKDNDALIDYLSANFGVDQPPYEAPTSAPEAKSKTKANH